MPFCPEASEAMRGMRAHTRCLMCHKTHKCGQVTASYKGSRFFPKARLPSGAGHLSRMHDSAPAAFMQTFEHIVALTAPLFILVLVGFGLTRWAAWPKPVSD